MAASNSRPADTERPLRADAQRNRDRLVTVARAAFHSAGDSVALETIARDAGVGIGTLYRHFPTRESLVDAVYSAELDEVTSSVDALLERFAPDDALRAWMLRYAEFVQTKRGMLQTLRAGWASGRIAAPTTRERVTASIATLLTAGIQAGAVRADADPDDVTTLIRGILLSTSNDDAPGQTERLLGLVVDALRPAQ